VFFFTLIFGIMSRGLLVAAVLAALHFVAVDSQCPQIDGNYYCAQTNAISFNNVGFAGSYNQVTNMDSVSCACSSTPVGFSGPLAPLNNEVQPPELKD
jgi:Cell wall protein YJL171C/Tos1, N-terminal